MKKLLLLFVLSLCLSSIAQEKSNIVVPNLVNMLQRNNQKKVLPQHTARLENLLARKKARQNNI